MTESEDEIESDWNHFRLQVLKQALAQIYEETIEIIRKDLRLSAEEWVKAQVQASFFSLINLGKIKKDNGKIISLVTDPDTQMFGQSHLAVTNNYGEVLEVASFNTLTLRKDDGLHDSDKFRSISDKTSLAKIIMQHQPEAIIIAANCLQALTLRKNVMTMIEKIQIDGFNEADTEFRVDSLNLLRGIIPVYMMDPQVPKLFASSQKAKRLFPEYKIFARMAISLARFGQNACAETLYLSSDPTEIQLKFLNLHPLQSLLNESSFLTALEIVALDFVSQTGVLINEVVQRDHLSILLSYVPGLGQVKDHGLLESIKQKSGGRLSMRAQLIGKRMLGLRVYENAAGFIRIPFEEGESDPLDSTRIHPESYELAKVTARSVFSDTHIRDENLIQEVMSRPQKMQELDLEAYSRLHLTKTGINIKEVLECIVRELTSPFFVPEKKFVEVSAEDLLYLTTGETRHSLKKGSIVQTCVVAFDDRRQVVRCRLECGLEATIDEKLIPEKKVEKNDKNDKNDKPESEKVVKGEVLKARVIEVSCKVQGKDVFFKVKLSMLPDDIINHGKYISLTLDDAFVMEDAD